MTASPRLRIVLVDDHLLVLEGLAALIGNETDMDVIGSATTGARAYGMIRGLKPDVAVLDLCMPDMSGLAVARRLTDEGAAVPLIALSIQEEQACFKQAMDAGFRGYVFKRSASANLLFAIRSVANGGFHIDPNLAGQIVQHNAIDPRPSGDVSLTLTARENEILKQTAFGFTIKEVAAQLGITEKSIEIHKARASQKLNLRSRANIVRYGMSQGWFEEARC